MASIINDLQHTDALPDKTESVSVVQTHISIVFVADDFVYKVKKPVNFGFLDFTTLEKREFYCHQEIKLNRRLSKDIYLEVLPVVVVSGRHIIGEASGEIVDYAVKMRRIPEDTLMKSLFGKGALTREHLSEVSRTLAKFHQDTVRNPEIDRFGMPDQFRINTDENFSQVEKYIGISIQVDEFNALKLWTDAFYKEQKDLFLSRLEAERIRDCHGDLHMEHICFFEGVSMIDCIEFNDRFRYSDTVADIAFLLMDLEYHGGKDEAAVLWQFYKKFAGEKNVDSLLTFYKIYRAFVRGKVDSFQIDDINIGKDKKEQARQRAKRYFELACSYI